MMAKESERMTIHESKLKSKTREAAQLSSSSSSFPFDQMVQNKQTISLVKKSLSVTHLKKKL